MRARGDCSSCREKSPSLQQKGRSSLWDFFCFEERLGESETRKIVQERSRGGKERGGGGGEDKQPSAKSKIDFQAATYGGVKKNSAKRATNEKKTCKQSFSTKRTGEGQAGPPLKKGSARKGKSLENGDQNPHVTEQIELKHPIPGGRGGMKIDQTTIRSN